MTPEQLNADFETRYKAEIAAGGSVQINHRLPSVADTSITTTYVPQVVHQLDHRNPSCKK